MKMFGAKLQISATDLANHLACRHITTLDLQVVGGEIKREYREDPRIEALIERGKRHEAAYLSHLESLGLNVLKDDGWLQRTIDAMKKGVDVIAQAYLSDGRWHGRADVLLKVKRQSNLGEWSYEVVDTKLARETKGGTILQLCLYSELVEKIQGLLPAQMHIITPLQPEIYRTLDYLWYHRFVKSRLENAINTNPETYPEPVEHCDICSWWPVCNDRRRNDDHLSFVAGISKLQMRELDKLEIRTLASLVETPFPKDPERGSIESYDKIRHQARLQHQYHKSKKPIHELLDLEPERGLARLPEPSPGDLFFDFESDPFVEEGGIEYLLGYLDLEGNYTALWGLDRLNERQMFERFIDLVMERWERFPELHLYHFSQYEETALKRLAGRHATREDELDRMLRAKVLVDLHRVLKQTLRASVERYSLKDLEIFFGFKRKTDLRDASKNLRTLECALELDDVQNLSPEILKVVKNYNFEDCVATLELRNWLETIRKESIDEGKEILRPTIESGEPSEEVHETRKKVLSLMRRLLTGIPADSTQHNAEQHARWLIAHMLEWHRRENKATWWELFRLRDLTDEELLEERRAISDLQFIGRFGGTDKCPIHRYTFPLQEIDIREEDELKIASGDLGEVESIDILNRIVDVKKKGAMAEVHPSSVFAYKSIRHDVISGSLFRLGTWIAKYGVTTAGPYQAARDLLLRNRTFERTGGDITDEAKRLVLQLDHTVLPIQGPPGAGKTYTGARMICELVRHNKKVGITAMSHKVIRKLLNEVVKAADEEGLHIQCIQKTDHSYEEVRVIAESEDNAEVLDALQNNEVQVAAGTAWLWSRKEFVEAVDVLFVDEAGQMSLADVLAVSQAAKSVVLLGDPRQLNQPLQGTHPPGVAVSALQHILDKEETMPKERGIFMDHTWRLAPSICEFTSELFYDQRLQSRDQLANQRLEGTSRFTGSGLFFVPVEHEGNQNSSDEEVDVVVKIVHDLLQPGVSWVNGEGESKSLTVNDILIVAPYNAQVFKLSERLPDIHIGTVDKFQGQEAPVVIYSMTTSSPEEAPRGMEFLYSLNRFNVATSRAKCVCILVASPRLFEPECKSPRQMKLANALCRYLEMAVRLTLPDNQKKKE